MAGVFLGAGISPIEGQALFDYGKIGLYEIFVMILGIVMYVLMTLVGIFINKEE